MPYNYDIFISDGGFVLMVCDNFWTDMFTKYFLEAPDDDLQKDDLLFYVKKSSAKSKLNIPRVCTM
jgi:hypothetical protein